MVNPTGSKVKWPRPYLLAEDHGVAVPRRLLAGEGAGRPLEVVGDG